MGGERCNIPVSHHEDPWPKKKHHQLSRGKQRGREQNGAMAVASTGGAGGLHHHGHRWSNKRAANHRSPGARQAVSMEINTSARCAANDTQNWGGAVSLPPQRGASYAGPKFSQPPSPSILPKPPSHWVPLPLSSENQEALQAVSMEINTSARCAANDTQNWGGAESLPPQQGASDAGPKFSEPPSPSMLPKPPSQWVLLPLCSDNLALMTFQLKRLLKLEVC